MDYQVLYLSRARRFARLMSFVPFVRFVGLNGSLARLRATRESDIDLLVIAMPGRIYTVRLLTTAILALTPWRRQGVKVAGRICLNCFLSEDHLDIRPENKRDERRVALSNLAMVPLFDPRNIHKKFMKQNLWMSCFATKTKNQTAISLNKAGQKTFQSFMERFWCLGFGKQFENWQMDYQSRRILRGKKPNDETYISESFIKLHPEK